MLTRLRNDPALLALLCALVAVVVLYAPTLSYGLVDYDDGYLIRDNWVVRDASWASVHTIFFDLDSPKRFVLSPEYLPIRDLSMMFDCAVWGDWLPGFHATNLVLYLASIILWFDVLVRFGVPRTVAATAMVLWALHPSHAESVAWLAERKGLLGMTFAGACGACYTRYRDGRTLWLGLAMLASVCAVWSKAHAAFAVAALAGLELVRLPAGRERTRAIAGIGAVGVCAALAFIPVLRMAASSQVVGLTSHAPGGRGALVLGVHGLYVELATMLRSNAVAYPLSTAGPSVVEMLVGVIALIALVFALFAPRGRRWSLSFVVRSAAILWFLGWFPVSHLALPLQMIVVADRYLLIPSLGFCLALAALAMSISSVRARRALLGAVVIAAAGRTLAAQSSWRDGESLWSRAVESNPGDGEAWSAYAEAVARNGDAERGEKIVVEGLTHVRTGRLLMRSALFRIARGDFAGGLALMREASEGGEPRAMANLALLLLRSDPTAALTWARKGATLMPMYAPVRRAAGKAELANGNAAAAEPEFRRAHDLEPTCTNAYNLALALLRLQRTDEAHALLEPCRGDRVLGTSDRGGASPMTDVAVDRWTGWRPRVGIAVLVFALFLPSLWFTQSGYDDDWLWAVDSPLRHVDGDVLHHVWFELDAHARHDVGTEYLPVRDMLTAADMAVWGDGYRGPHATQLMLYLLSVLALGSLLIRWGVRSEIAWLGTLLWAVHPLHVEAVGWISERKGILAGLFAIALGHAWIRYRSDRSAAWLVAAVFAAIAATWSKAPAMFVPAVFAAWDLLVLPAHRRRWIAIFSVGAATALAAIPVFIVARGGGVVDSTYEVAHDPRIVAAIGGIGHYALGVVGVREPSLSYPVQTDGASALELSIGILVVGVAVALWVIPRRPQLAWRRAWLAWAAILYFPISHLATRIHIPVADRYVYLVILAPCVGVAAMLVQLRGVVRLAAIGSLVAALCILSIKAERAWTGRLQLWDHAFATNPRDVKACQNLTESLFFYTQFPEALAVVDGGLAVRPDDPYLLGLRSMVLGALHRRDESFADSARAAASGHASLMFAHASRLEELKRYNEALPFAERAALKRPDEQVFTWRQITILTALHRYTDAERVAIELERRFPGSASEMVAARVYAAWRRPDFTEFHLTTARLLGAYASAVRNVRDSLTLPIEGAD